MATEITRPRFRRRRYIVAKGFQLRYVGWILLLMFLTAALCSYVVYYTSMILMGEKLANVYPQGRLVHILKLVNSRILVSVLLISPLVAVVGIFLSHKIAGPLYRIERFLNSMALGNIGSRLVLRRGDELVSLANSINHVADSIKQSITSQKTRLSNVLAEINNLTRLSSQKIQLDPDLTNVISKVSEEIDALKKELERYKIEV